MQKKKHDLGTLESLARVIADRIANRQQARVPLRIVRTPRPTLFDSITREGILRRIRWLQRTYGLQFMIDHATFNMPNLDCLEDADLSDLLRDMERARECYADGVSLEDAGLIKPLPLSDIHGMEP